MRSKKLRLTVTVDPALAEAGRRAVDSGAADSISSWVSAAMEEKSRRDMKLALLAEAVASYEKEFGEISPLEMADLSERDRNSSTIVRGGGILVDREADHV